MRIAVFGATGKLGQALIDYLSKREPGWELYAVGHRPDNIFTQSSIRYFSVNIEDAATFSQLPDQVDAVINLAAAVTTRVDSSDVHRYVATNIIGAVNIMDYARRSGADRLVYAQTYNDVLGNPKNDRVIHPDASRKSVYIGESALYAITKNTAVDLLHYYEHQYGLKAFVMRLPNIYVYTRSPYYLVGGQQRMRPFRKMIKQACEGEPIEIWGDPGHVMDMVYVEDFCQMFHLAVKADTNGGTYNVGTGVGTTLQQQVEGMIEAFSPVDRRSTIVYCPEKPNGTPFIMDIENARQDLGYTPHFSYMDLLWAFREKMEEDGQL